MKASKIRPFIPSIDFRRSITFYKELGFEITYEEEKLVIMSLGEISFFIQDAYVKDWAENTMIQLFIDDLEALYDKTYQLSKTYQEIKVNPIFQAHYGKTFHLIGPEGVLWHVMQNK